jgi:predicted TPR repeat methyltransferase
MAAMSSDLERARAAFLAGVRQHEAGALEAAERSYLEALAALPGRPSTLLNLALVRLALGRPDEALAGVRQVLQADPTDADAWAAAGRALQALGRPADELEAIDRLCALRPPTAALSHRRGLLLLRLERPAEALAAFDAALALDPAHAAAWTQRGSLLREAGRRDEAADCFRRALAHGGDEALNRWFLAGVTADVAPPQVPPQAPAHYVQALFDGYAAGFDEHLVGRLGYRAHEALVALLPAGRRWHAALDLGCGTGLCGALLRPRVQSLHGVDLSPAMLVQARARAVYDRLDEAELVDWLQRCEARYGLVVAADVFIYIGDLAPVFTQVARLLEPGGDFAFSVERPVADRPVSLGPQLRYGHGEAHLRHLAAGCGLQVAAIEPQVLRHEQQRAIDGLVCYLVRP